MAFIAAVCFRRRRSERGLFCVAVRDCLVAAPTVTINS